MSPELPRVARSARPTRRASIALRLGQDVVELSRRALRKRMEGASEIEVRLRWVELWYGADLARRVRADLAARAGKTEA